MSDSTGSPFTFPKRIGWVFLAGAALALLLADFLLHQRNPFERGIGGARPTLAVLYVEVVPRYSSDGIPAAPAESLAAALDTLLAPALARVAPDSVLATARLRELRAALGLPPAGGLTPRDALRLASLSGAPRFVVGLIERSPGGLAARLRLYSSGSGKVLATAEDSLTHGTGMSAAPALSARLVRKLFPGPG